jgi:catalase
VSPFASTFRFRSPARATRSPIRPPSGTLELTELETGRDTAGDILVFDPTRVTDGIELTDDPIPRFRSQAYSESVERRAGAARPAELD